LRLYAFDGPVRIFICHYFERSNFEYYWVETAAKNRRRRKKIDPIIRLGRRLNYIKLILLKVDKIQELTKSFCDYNEAKKKS